MRYSLGHRLLCVVCLYKLHLEKALKGCVRLCYVISAATAGCANQKKINVSAVSVAPCVFFQPLSSRLAYHGFSEQCTQCEQQDNWCHEQDQPQHQVCDTAGTGLFQH